MTGKVEHGKKMVFGDVQCISRTHRVKTGHGWLYMSLDACSRAEAGLEKKLRRLNSTAETQLSKVSII
jgi:hypothetical protein